MIVSLFHIKQRQAQLPDRGVVVIDMNYVPDMC